MTPNQARAKIIRGSGIHDAGVQEVGNIDLNARPVVRNSDGSISTVLSSSYRNNAGQEVLIPRVSDEGKIMTLREAQEYWGMKRQHLGKFASPSQADAYAEWLHCQQDKQYRGGK